MVTTEWEDVETWVEENYDPEKETAKDFIKEEEFGNDKAAIRGLKVAEKIERGFEREIDVPEPIEISPRRILTQDSSGQIHIRNSITGAFVRAGKALSHLIDRVIRSL